MKAHWIAVMLALAVSCHAAGQNAEEQVRQLDKQWAEADVKKDVATLNKILADDFTFVGPDGGLITKAQYIESLGDTVTESEVASDQTVRLYGNTAVVIGVVTVKQRSKGQDTGGVFRYTETLVKHGRSWQFVVAQVTPIAKK